MYYVRKILSYTLRRDYSVFIRQSVGKDCTKIVLNWTIINQMSPIKHKSVWHKMHLYCFHLEMTIKHFKSMDDLIWPSINVEIAPLRILRSNIWMIFYWQLPTFNVCTLYFIKKLGLFCELINWGRSSTLLTRGLGRTSRRESA